MRIYLVFTAEGYQEALAPLIEDKAALWINKAVLSVDQLKQLTDLNIKVDYLPKLIDINNEKEVLMALELIEQQIEQAEILVEYI